MIHSKIRIAEFVRRSGISRSHVYRVLNGHANPGDSFCAKTAAVFAMPPSKVFRLAGIIPSYQIPDAWLQRVMENLYTFTPEQLDILDAIINGIATSNRMIAKVRDGQAKI